MTGRSHQLIEQMAGRNISQRLANQAKIQRLEAREGWIGGQLWERDTDFQMLVRKTYMEQAIILSTNSNSEEKITDKLEQNILNKEKVLKPKSSFPRNLLRWLLSSTVIRSRIPQRRSEETVR